jgi:hypothetical protein
MELDDLVGLAGGDARLARTDVYKDLVSHEKSLRGTPAGPGLRRSAECAVERRVP